MCYAGGGKRLCMWVCLVGPGLPGTCVIVVHPLKSEMGVVNDEGGL